MDRQHISIKEVRQVDKMEHLDKLGHRHQKIYNHDYWYLSPLWIEKEPSFKVKRRLKALYDHGLGKGVNLLTSGFGITIVPLPNYKKKLENIFSFHQ